MMSISRLVPLPRTFLVVPWLPEGVISCLRHVIPSLVDVHSHVIFYWILQCLQKKIFGFSCLTVTQHSPQAVPAAVLIAIPTAMTIAMLMPIPTDCNRTDRIAVPTLSTDSSAIDAKA